MGVDDARLRVVRELQYVAHHFWETTWNPHQAGGFIDRMKALVDLNLCLDAVDRDHKTIGLLAEILTSSQRHGEDNGYLQNRQSLEAAFEMKLPERLLRGTR